MVKTSKGISDTMSYKRERNGWDYLTFYGAHAIEEGAIEGIKKGKTTEEKVGNLIVGLLAVVGKAHINNQLDNPFPDPSQKRISSIGYMIDSQNVIHTNPATHPITGSARVLRTLIPGIKCATCFPASYRLM